jgi:hypothetical protein
MSVPVTIDESVKNGTCLFCGDPTNRRNEPPQPIPVPATDDPLVLVRMCDDCAEDFERWRAEQRQRPE